MNPISNTATESIKAVPVRVAGTARLMSTIVDNQGTARALALRKNAADAIVVSPTDSTAGTFQNLSTTVHYAVGDTIDLQYRGTAPAFTMTAIGWVFDADSGTAAIYGGNSVSYTTGLVFMSPGGATETSEALAQFLVRAPATYKNMVASVTTSAAGNNTFNSRKNTAAGNMTITVGSGLTGIFEDTTHSDSLVSGDKWCFSMAAAGTTGLVAALSVTAVCTTDVSEVPFGFAASFNASNQFCGIWQGGTALSTTESTVALQVGVDGKFTNLRAVIDSNSMAGSSSLVFRKGGVTGNQVLTFGAGATGSFEDSTHTDSFTAASLVNFMFSGGTSGFISSGSTGMTFTPLTIGWFAPLSEPVRFLPGIKPSAQQFLAFDPIPIVPFGWFEPLSEPVRSLPPMPAGAKQFSAFNPQPFVSFSWFEALSEPAVKTLPGLSPRQQQFTAFHPAPSPFVATGWYVPLSEPVRFRHGIAASRQQFIAAPSQLRPNPTTTGVLSATETKDSMLGAGTGWHPAGSAELSMRVDRRGGGVGIPAQGSAGAAAIARVGISIRIVSS
jgi:hypothetical protein